jgi:uncharacterized protein YPO0396
METPTSMESPTTLFEGPPSPRRKGLRMWRAEVLNWGTLGEDVVHGADLQGGWLCITGRNGTGKSTLADAIITAFPPANARIHYNAAGGAKNTKERTRLTYLRGFYGHEQDDTGKAQPSALRTKPGSLTAILLQFHEESSKRWVTVLVLGTFSASNEEHWLYGLIEEKADLSVVQGKEDWESRAKRLRKAGWSLTADPAPYRERLRTALRIPSDKAITTFVRTVGLKDIGDVNAFIRGNMLDDVSVHDRYVDLTKHYQKQLEIDAEIELTKRMIEVLKPLGELVPQLKQFAEELLTKPAVEAAVEWRINKEKADLLESLRAGLQREIEEAQSLINGATQDANRAQETIKTLNASEPAQRVAALAARATQLAERRQLVSSRLTQLRAALGVIGGRVPDDQDGFHAMRERLDALVKQADAGEEERGDTLAEKKKSVETLRMKLAELQEHIDALAQHSSHLPMDDLSRRDEIAKAMSLRSTELPYIGELIDVDSTHNEWRIALEKLLRTQARRMLVPNEHFSRVAAYVNGNNFGARVRLERVPAKTVRFTMDQPDARRAYARLRIKSGTAFADWLHNTLRTRFDHVCFKSVQDYEKHTGSALTIDGFVKDRGDYHEKRDDIHIRGVRDYFLGWDNTEKVRSLRADKADLDQQVRDAADGVSQQRSSNDTAKARRDLAMEVLKNLPTFDMVDMGAVNRDLAALEKERQHLAKSDPEAAKVEADLADANSDLLRFQQVATDQTGRKGGLQQQHAELGTLLIEIDDWKADAKEPVAPDLNKAGAFFTEPMPSVAKGLEKWSGGVLKRFRDRFESVKDSKLATESDIRVVMSKFLTTFPTEAKDLSPTIDATDAFIDRLRHLEGEKLHDLQDRFRKYLEGNLALHVSQLNSELEGQVGKSERRIDDINKILAQIPWEGTAVIQILPRPSPQLEIKKSKELFARASAPLFAPTEEQRLSAFAAVKELIEYLANENVRKIALDARHRLLFAVELTDPTVEVIQHRRQFYLENTDGLSGGQKNKLSVTLLASALAFQYDVAGARAIPGTFRTVIIDEAFARLDSENARYALELFRKFDFQLILVHPLDGTVRVAEDYVHGFLLATIRDNKYTSLTGVRIEQFKQLVAEAETEKSLEHGKRRSP